MKPAFPSPERFRTARGRTLYALSLEVFPGFFSNVYVISDGERRALVDCGSGLDGANHGLDRGLDAITKRFGEPLSVAGLDSVLITHGHIDHFGGAAHVRQHCDAPIGIHPLDRRVLTSYEERLVVAAKYLRLFLEGAGLSPARCEQLMQLYGFAKHHYRSVEVEFPLAEGAPVLGKGGVLELEVHHVPGHCPGQVCIQVDDVLLTADHVLARITPHQSPESITLNMGLGHYLESLTKIERLDGVTLALGGHEQPMSDLRGRISEIKQAHGERLEQVIAHCADPASTAEISQRLFGKVQGYNVLLALEETGAHVEYLHQRGELVVANLDEVERETRPVLRYWRA